MCGTVDAVMEHVARSGAAQRVSVVGTALPRDVTSPKVTSPKVTSPNVRSSSVVGTAMRSRCFLSKSSTTKNQRHSIFPIIGKPK